MWNSSESVSVSFRESGDDEEALQWAALERLPTYNRVRKGVFKNIVGELIEIDVQKLELEERKVVLNRLVESVDDDWERFFLRIRQRFDKVDMQFPKIEVRFQNLNVSTYVHVGSRALPTITNFMFNMTEALLRHLRIYRPKRRKLSILDNMSGIIRPSRLTLLLGPPSSGKTTLLLALAGRLGHDLQMSGNVTYNGHSLKEFVPQRTSAYVSQQDWHVPEMTVRETLDFSARCQGVGCKYDMLEELARREKSAGIKPDEDLDIFMKASALGGQETSLIVEYILKILGLDVCADTLVGDEMLKGISGGQKKRLTTGELLAGPLRVLFMDEISNGLDSSTTHQIIKYLRHSSQALDGTTGPRDSALDFFASMGFQCPERKNVADFLQEVISKKDQEQYWVVRDRPYHYISVLKFAEAFRSHHLGKSLGEELDTPFDRRYSHPAALSTSQYGVSRIELLKTSFDWQVLLMKRNSFIYVFKFIQLFFVALITMKSGFWVMITYYVIGFDPNIVRFFRQFLLFFFLHQMSISLFRLMGALGRNMIVANTFGSFAMLIVMALGGYVISRDSIPRWWIWGFWISPLMYGQDASSVNEFLGHSWDKRIGNNSTMRLGDQLLKARSLFPQKYWYWIGVSALLGYTVLFNILFTFSLTYLNPLVKQQAVVSEEELQERDNRKKGEGETKVVNIQLREYLEHSGSLTGKSFDQRGMVLPFQPLSMSFSNISYYVDVPLELKQQGVTEDRLQLLVDITGAFRPEVDIDTQKAFVEEVMELVELTPLKGRTIVCTIHQPSIDIFESFDELVFMKRGGELIYAGPLGPKSYKLVEYLEAIQGVPKIRSDQNPATWMLEVTSSLEENRLGVDFAQIYRGSNLYQRNRGLVERLNRLNINAKELNFPTKYSQSKMDQFLACLWKQNLCYWRNPQYSAVRFFYTVIISLMLGTICWRFGSKRDNQQDIFNAMGSIERAAGMYSALPFALAQVAIEFPYVLGQALIYSTVFYAMASFEWTLLKFTCGFMIPHKNIPIWWRWYYWANPVAWTLYGLVVSQYGDSDAPVKLSDGVTVLPAKLLIKHVLGFRHDFLGIAGIMVVGFCVLFALIFAYAIKTFNFQKR
ncbi:ABC transporter G family member 32 like [Heracleum sosnowskyi]|uniref:ABC transporter G family member 32 like n=1 Tax=Heracleum sosnowskyi TaxID=360622 RepID=A0AAD8J390_9APIA|nr:ABC transporter G family member 32 like [Heracleum sosnowskyi]